MRRSAKSVGYIGIGETAGAFLLVGLGTSFVARATGVGDPAWSITHYLELSLLLGAISVATAPAATLHVMRELKAAGHPDPRLEAVLFRFDRRRYHPAMPETDADRSRWQRLKWHPGLR